VREVLQRREMGIRGIAVSVLGRHWELSGNRGALGCHEVAEAGWLDRRTAWSFPAAVG